MAVVHKTFKNNPAGGGQVEELVDLEGTKEAIDATSGTLRMIKYDNTLNSAVTYLKLFNAAAGSVTLGSTEPDFIIPCPAATEDSIEFPEGIAYGTALTGAATTTATLAGVTSPTATFSVDFVIST